MDRGHVRKLSYHRELTGGSNLVQDMLGTKRAAIEAVRVFRLVFDIPLFELKSLGSWVGFESGNPGLSRRQ